MKIAEQISRLRARAGMSQGELADRLEVSRQSVSKWETGASVPEIDKLVKMSALFGVTLDELVTGDAPEPVAAEKPVSLRHILGAALLVLAGACAAAMVLLESVIAFHRSEVVLLAVWFALLGAMVLEPGNRKLRVLALAIWGAAALALLRLHLLRLAAFQGGGLFVLIGLTLAGWTWHETGR